MPHNREILFRLVNSFLKKAVDSYAAKNLKTHLSAFLRPELMAEINSEKVISDLEKEFKTADNFFMEEAVDEFITKKTKGKGDGDDKQVGSTSVLNLRNTLIVKALKLDLSREEAKNLVMGKNDLPKGSDKILKSLGKIAMSYLKTSLNRDIQDMKRKKKKTEEEWYFNTGENFQSETSMDSELKKEKPEWAEGLIKDILDLLNREIKDEDRRKIFKIILKDNFLAEPKKKKSLKELSKEFKIPQQTLQSQKEALAALLHKFLSAQGLDKTYLEEGGLSEKDLKIPDYQKHLKDNPEDTQDLKDSFNFKSKVSPLTKKVCDLLAEGKSSKEIASEIGDTPEATIRQIKSRTFVPLYEKWYKKEHKKIVEACLRIRLAMQVFAAAPQMSPEEVEEMAAFVKTFKKSPKPKKSPEPTKPVMEKDKKEPVDGGALSSAAHKGMAAGAIKKGDLEVTIYFSSDYNSMDFKTPEKRKEIEDKANFKYLKYEADLKEERNFGKKEHTIDYHYERDLNEDGTFKGSAKSRLGINDRKVSDSDDLKEYLDGYMEDKVIPEGILPHGDVSVRYINTAEKKGEYRGIRKFRKFFPDGLGFVDPAHMKRKKEYENLQKRKIMGPGGLVPSTQRDEAQISMGSLKDELKDEKKKPHPDQTLIRKLEKSIKVLKDIIKGTVDMETDEIDKLLEEYENIVRASERLAAPIFPPPQSEKSKDLIEMFTKYDMDLNKPNPNMWLLPEDLKVLARTLKISAENHMKKALANYDKKKGIDPGEKEQGRKEIIQVYDKDIAETLELFKSFIKDLKDRKDKLSPKDLKIMVKNNNMNWVDSDKAVQDVLKNLKTELYKETAPNIPRQKNKKVVEINKYESLLDFVEELKEGLESVVGGLAKAGLTPSSDKAQDRVYDERNKIKNSIAELEKLVSQGNSGESEEEKKDFAKLESDLAKYKQEAKEVDDRSTAMTNIPAYDAAASFKIYFDYFASIFSTLARFTWYADKQIHKTAEEGESSDKPVKIVSLEKIKKLRDNIVKNTRRLSGKSIYKQSIIEASIKAIKKDLKEFLDKIYMAGVGVTASRAVLPYGKISAEEPKKPSHKEFVKGKIFPEKTLQEAHSILKTLKGETGVKGVKKFYEEAKKDLDDIKSTVFSFLKEDGLRTIKELAKKQGVSVDKAGKLLAKTALDKFIVNWGKIVEEGGKHREQSPLGNRGGEHTDKMEDFVESMIPVLFDRAPSDKKGPEIPSAGIPTPKKIRERIEESFGRAKPGEMKEVFQQALDDVENKGGGGGSKSKGRPKNVRVNPPSGTKEELKRVMLGIFKSKNAKQVVLSLMMYYVMKIRKILGADKNSYMDIDDVMEGFESLLKTLYNTLLTLKVEPSRAQVNLPPKGAPELTGKPEIPIDSFDEAESLFNKLKQMYDEINTFLPEKEAVGLPPADLSKNRSKSGPRSYLPRGLTDWYEVLRKEKEEGKAKKAYHLVPSQSASNVAARFAGISVDVPENESLFLR